MTQLQQQIQTANLTLAVKALATAFQATPVEQRQALLDEAYQQIIQRIFQMNPNPR